MSSENGFFAEQIKQESVSKDKSVVPNSKVDVLAPLVNSEKESADLLDNVTRSLKDFGAIGKMQEMIALFDNPLFLQMAKDKSPNSFFKKNGVKIPDTKIALLQSLQDIWENSPDTFVQYIDDVYGEVTGMVDAQHTSKVESPVQRELSDKILEGVQDSYRALTDVIDPMKEKESSIMAEMAVLRKYANNDESAFQNDALIASLQQESQKTIDSCYTRMQVNQQEKTRLESQIMSIQNDIDSATRPLLFGKKEFDEGMETKRKTLRDLQDKLAIQDRYVQDDVGAIQYQQKRIEALKKGVELYAVQLLPLRADIAKLSQEREVIWPTAVFGDKSTPDDFLAKYNKKSPTAPFYAVYREIVGRELGAQAADASASEKYYRSLLEQIQKDLPQAIKDKTK